MKFLLILVPLLVSCSKQAEQPSTDCIRVNLINGSELRSWKQSESSAYTEKGAKTRNIIITAGDDFKAVISCDSIGAAPFAGTLTYKSVIHLATFNIGYYNAITSEIGIDFRADKMVGSVQGLPVKF